MSILRMIITPKLMVCPRLLNRVTKYMVYMGPQRLRAYNQVSEWTFKNGKVTDCKDLNSVIQSFRNELEEKAGDERTNPFLKIETKAYLSLSDYQKEWWINYL